MVLACWAVMGVATPTPAAGQDDEIPVEVEVISVERLDHSTQLLVELRNPGNSTIGYLALADPAYRGQQLSHDDLSGIHLLDEATNVEYLPYQDRERTLCVCSRFPAMREGEIWTAWWRSAPLPDTVRAVTVLGPNGEELAADVEVQG